MKFELLKLLRSRRPVLAIFILLFFLALMLFGFYTYAETETGGQAEFRYTFENRSYFNGLIFTLYAFYFGFLLIIPILVATEGGVQIAGETSSRTLLLLLARPISHQRLFFSKLIVSTVYLFLLIGSFLTMSLLISLLAVGWGDLNIYPGVLKMAERHQFLPQAEALTRFAIAWPAASLALFVNLSLSYLLSSWMKSPVNAVGISIAVYLIMYVVCEIHFFEKIRPYLFTSYQSYWRGLFREIIPWRSIVSDAAKLLGFACLFLALSLRRFRLREEI